MIEYKKPQPKTFKSHLDTSDTNGCNIIIAVHEDAVYILKNSPARWVSIKTGQGYDLAGSFKGIREACDAVLAWGGRVIISESKGMHDCKTVRDALINALPQS